MASVGRSTRLSLTAAIKKESDNEETDTSSQEVENKKELKKDIKREVEEVLMESDTLEDEAVSKKMTSVRRSTRLSLVAAKKENDNGETDTVAQKVENKKEMKKKIKTEIEEVWIESDTSEDEAISRKRRKVISSDSEYVMESQPSSDAEVDEVKKRSAASSKADHLQDKRKVNQQQKNVPKRQTMKKIKPVKNEAMFNDFLPPKNKTAMTPLEALRRKNIEEKMQLFQELKLDEARDDLEEAVREVKAAKRASKVSLQKKENLPLRKSLRLEGIQAAEVDYRAQCLLFRSPASPSFRCTRPPMTSYGRDWGDAPRNCEIILPMLEVKLPKFSDQHCQNAIASCCNNMIDCKEKDTSIAALSIKQFKDAMRHAKLTHNHKMKVTPSRIYSMAFHPSFNGTLLAAGCKSGAVGVWNASLDSKYHDAGLITFNYQVKPTSCVSFSETEPYSLYSTSYDGTFRKGDLQKETFTLLHCTSEEERDNHLNWHTELNPGVFLVSQGNGCLIQLDTREPDSKIVTYKCYDRSMRTISVHPVTKQHILTASSTRVVSMWDIRSMKKSICNIPFSKVPSGAFFSPITGNKVLCSSYENNIAVYSTDLTTFKLQSKTTHNNNTGRWVTNFKAMWHPQREDVFIVGCMERPRKLEIFHTNETETVSLVNLRHAELFTTVGAVAVFHPTAPVVACGNASGYIHLFE